MPRNMFHLSDDLPEARRLLRVVVEAVDSIDDKEVPHIWAVRMNAEDLLSLDDASLAARAYRAGDLVTEARVMMDEGLIEEDETPAVAALYLADG